MENQDTIQLLKECDAGIKMAIASIEEVADKVIDTQMQELLEESKTHHRMLERELRNLLHVENESEKEPNPMAKGMSWLKTNMKMTMNNSDATIADLITDGCNMGIKTLFRYKNQYPAASEQANRLCMDIISIEQDLRSVLRTYL